MVGRTYVHYDMRQYREGDTVLDEKSAVCNVSWPLEIFKDNIALPGQFLHPFSVQIPKKLENSMAFAPWARYRYATYCDL